jgi:hypothetical protein
MADLHIKESLVGGLCELLVAFVQCIVNTLRLFCHMASLVILNEQASTLASIRRGSVNNSHFPTVVSMVECINIVMIGLDGPPTATAHFAETRLADVKRPR